MRFSFYTVDAKYCDYLRKADKRVPYTMEKKATRPFVGIVFSVNGFYYYAPLTSPKPKHLSMKNQADFLKINNGVWGAINFNNMIPVLPVALKEIDAKFCATDNDEEAAYKTLLSNQLTWCNAHKEEILAQSKNLYNLIVNDNAWDNLKNRCCDFQLLEAACRDYMRTLEKSESHEKSDPQERPSVLGKLEAAKQAVQQRDREHQPRAQSHECKKEH